MTDEVMAQLKAHEQSVVRMACRDGRTLVAKIVHVDEEYRDVLYNAVAESDQRVGTVFSPVSILPLAEITAVHAVR